ncbi:MAG: HEPN domain-containing protein [Pelolinea sp.]|nr:HEPN domain-containing protein [Pelolinea sp.]
MRHATVFAKGNFKPKGDFILFSLENYGTLILDGEDAINYRETLNYLIESVNNEKISNKAIEKLFQRTILLALDIEEKEKNISFKSRIENAKKELINSLKAEPTIFSVYYPVQGISLEGLPLKVGNVLFCNFGKEHFKKVKNILIDHKDDELTKQNKKVFLDFFKKSKTLGKLMGLIEIKAIDDKAAKELAKKEIISTLEIINFFGEFIPYQDGFAYLPGEQRERHAIFVPILKQGPIPNVFFGGEVVGPLMPVPISKLQNPDKKIDFGFIKASNLLLKQRNKLEEKIISALQWAGKAAIESSKEKSFLLYAISLESLVLLENDHDELTYRLRTRCAHLLGINIENRKKVSEKIDDLYKIRSKIVHSGWYQVTDADLSLIRAYTLGCILRILNEEPFSSMNDPKQLVEWFNEQILG